MVGAIAVAARKVLRFMVCADIGPNCLPASVTNQRESLNNRRPSGLVGLGLVWVAAFVAGAADVLGVLQASPPSIHCAAGGLGDAPLELAGVFADEDW